MAGLLDGLMDDEGFRLGLGLLAAGGARRDNASFGQRLMEGVGYADNWKEKKKQSALDAMKMEEAKAAMEQQKALRLAASQSMISPSMANAMSMGPMPDGSAMPTVQPGFDNQGYINKLFGMGMPDKAVAYQSAIQKDNKPFEVAAGGTLVDRNTLKPIFTAPKAQPSAVQEYEFAKTQGYPGSFVDFQLAQKKAGATNVSTKIENKMGEGVASQIGPMVKDSKIQVDGAVKMYDAADRIEKAIASGKVSSGPFTSQVQTVRQLVQKVGGGNDESIRQTRQVIKSLAQMSVEARKQLQGQGQVTESEAAAVAKAEAGNIDDMTIGELQDLSTLTKRASHYTAKSHNELLTGLEDSDATKGLAKFYRVNGMDTLLQHTPTLPKIGGNPVDSLVDKYRTKQNGINR